MAEMIIGRSGEAAVLIDDGKVSRRHARLRFRNEIAGDFYDYLALDERLLGFFVADVSGKGMPAALFMATVRSLLRESLQFVRSPAQVLARLNDAISRNNPKLMFVTVLLGIYDPVTGRALVARGGHPLVTSLST